MVNTEEIFKFLHKADDFRGSKEFAFFQFLNDNRLVASVLNSNYAELIKFFDYHNKPELDNKMWSSNRKFRWKLQRKIIRLISNYLSSVFWTVDYSRNKIENHISKNSQLLLKFRQIKSSFADDALHRFIQDSRNYITHNSFLNITSEWASDIEWDAPKRNIYVSKTKLLKSSIWTTKSKAFLLSQDEKIYLIDLMQDHYSKFISFYNWTYIAIIATDLDFSSEMLRKMMDLYEHGETVKLTHVLPFNRAYFRYLYYLTNKGTSLES